jgi:hypothetical protein
LCPRVKQVKTGPTLVGAEDQENETGKANHPPGGLVPIGQPRTLHY